MKAGWKNIIGIERYCTFLMLHIFIMLLKYPNLSLLKSIIYLLPNVSLSFSDVSFLFAFFISAAVNLDLWNHIVVTEGNSGNTDANFRDLI